MIDIKICLAIMNQVCSIWYANFPPQKIMADSISVGLYSSLHLNAPLLARTTLKDQVASLLRENIVKGKLPPGSKLIERELAAWLNVSRMPIHDAMVQLEKEGLVVSRSDARYVTRLNRQDLIDLSQVRIVLERLSAELAAKNSSPQNAAQYEPLLPIMKLAAEKHDIDAFIDGHTEIHRTIWRQARNPSLHRALDSILGLIMMFMTRSETINWDETLERHHSIILPIQMGNPAEAGECMAYHISQSLDHTLRSLGES